MLALSHGNGFAIDAYAPFWAPLAADFQLCHFDVRHHGWNASAGADKTGIDRYADDFDRVYAAVRRLADGAPVIGAFHSLSAIVALFHAANRGRPVDGLILFDPPVQPPPGHALAAFARQFELKLADWSAGRPDRFESPEILAAEFARSRSLSGWVDGAHGLMARSILREAGAGDWRLRCPLAVEARNYRDNADLISWPLFERVDLPVLLICGDPAHGAGQSPARVCELLALEFPVGYRPIAGTTHMLQLERPAECRAEVAAFVDGVAAGRLLAG
jgi:pimeloyl-ACP methyl ester carboxylesterase